MDIRNIADQFILDVKKILGTSFQKAILYGSYARGDYKESSDVDIMILTSLSEEEIKEVENAVFDAAYEYMFHDGIDISVNIKNFKQFEYWLGALPYYDNIQKEGLTIAG